MGKVVGKIFAPEEKFTCPVCGKEYKSESALNRHMEDKHSPAANGTGGAAANCTEE